MLQKPKHFPVYTMSYHNNGKIIENTIIAKIYKTKEPKWIFGSWGEVDIISINIEALIKSNISHYNRFSCPSNTYENSDSILVPKDTWIKYVKKANKLIDEANKQGANIKRISY